MKDVTQALAMVAVGTILGLAINFARTDGVSLGRPIYAQAAASEATCSVPSIERPISAEEALLLHRSHRANFLDVRTAGDYAQGHIAEALHLPCRGTAGGTAWPEWLGRFDRARTLVLYDAKGDSAQWAAQTLSARGHRDVRVLRGGFDAWRAAGGPAESGTCESCR